MQHIIHMGFFYSLDGDGEDVDSIFLVAEVCITFKSCATVQRIFKGKRHQYKKINELQIFTLKRYAHTEARYR